MSGDKEDDGGLTDAGWPRERHGGWPIPWVSPRKQLKQTDEARLQACGTGAVCAVCGLGYQRDEKALLLINPPDNDTFDPGDWIVPADGGYITPIDNGVLHRHCARLALAWCPKLKQLVADRDLVAVEVVAHTARPQFLDLLENGTGHLVATFDEGLVVDLPL